MTNTTEWLKQRVDLLECEYGGRTVATLEACLKRKKVMTGLLNNTKQAHYSRRNTVRSSHICLNCNPKEKLIKTSEHPTVNGIYMEAMEKMIERMADRIVREAMRI